MINQDPKLEIPHPPKTVMHPPGIPPRATKKLGSPESPSNQGPLSPVLSTPQLGLSHDPMK